ncbi:MAG TPA: DUF5985 family protein [Myxococcales bacterium]|nr:DUF5985 family protein [Myxococcales bacterium]
MIAASAVYVLSVLVGVTCTVLLVRAHARSPSRLLLSAALCFAGLALNDLGLIVDVFVLPDVSIVAVRSLPAVIGLAVLVRALVKEGG